MTLERRIWQGGYNQKEVPPKYQEIIESDPEKQKAVELLVSQIPESIELETGEINLEDSTVLDLGAGTGAVEDKIKDRVGKVIALDKAEAMVSHIQKRFTGSEKVEPIVGDMTKIPLADNSVEVIISAGAIRELPVVKDGEVRIEEIENDFLRELMRVTKKGGVCILDSTRNANNDYVQRQFVKRRQEELDRYKPGDKDQVAQRENIFLTDDIKDKDGGVIKGIGSRLKDLGYDCEVETLFDPEGKNQSAAVRIKLLEK